MNFIISEEVWFKTKGKITIFMKVLSLMPSEITFSKVNSIWESQNESIH